MADREHELSMECWCKPILRIDDEGPYVCHRGEDGSVYESSEQARADGAHEVEVEGPFVFPLDGGQWLARLDREAH